jgi:serine/threonine-protein kinase HipA
VTRLDVHLERFETPVGALASADDGSLSFTYAPPYLADPARVPISLSFPLQEAAFGDAATRAFFRNLLPENDQLDQVVEREGLDKSDIVGLLRHLGADLSGALSCLPEGAPPVKVPGSLADDYVPLSQEQLERIVTRLGTSQPLPDELRDPSPVAGIQRKVALSETADGFAAPKPGSGAPTTHILKVPDTALPREAFYEDRCARLARGLGLDAAPSRSAWIAGYEVLIATRYDRRVEDGRVYRIHQEDFAQALGLPPRLKYEREGRPHRAFDAAAIARLLRATAVPAEAVLAFLRATFFNLAIGNTDNHAKNHALLYDRGIAPRLAPLYDLVPIRLSQRHHHLFSFRIGKATELAVLTSDDLLALLATFGIEGPRAARFLQREIVPLLEPLLNPAPAESEWRERLDRQIVEDTQRILNLVAPLVRRPTPGRTDTPAGWVAEGAAG